MMPLNEREKKERSEYLGEQLKITECSQRKPYVFISYASDNWRTVFKGAVVPLQRLYGLRVYADKAFDQVNDRWIVPMLRNLRGADAMLAFISQSYIESYACFLELLTAVNNKKQIVFVSLEEALHLGDTTDQPNIERGVKNEILNQGGNIATNTNNTSNDVMRAMKSAYTSLSTLLQQDALSKYDISDAFINFFRDAYINKKTIYNLGALKDTIVYVSSRVFEESPVIAPAPVINLQPGSESEFIPTFKNIGQPECITGKRCCGAEQKKVNECAHEYGSGSVVRSQSPEDGGPGSVRQDSIPDGERAEDMPYTYGDGITGVYTGQWKNERPFRQGVIRRDDGGIYTGQWAKGRPNGQGTYTGPDGDTFTGEFKDGNFVYGKLACANGDIYEGHFRDGRPGGQGTLICFNGDTFTGRFEDGSCVYGELAYANGDVYEGKLKDGNPDGQGTYTDVQGRILSGSWEMGRFRAAEGRTETGSRI